MGSGKNISEKDLIIKDKLLAVEHILQNCMDAVMFMHYGNANPATVIANHFKLPLESVKYVLASYAPDGTKILNNKNSEEVNEYQWEDYMLKKANDGTKQFPSYKELIVPMIEETFVIIRKSKMK